MADTKVQRTMMVDTQVRPSDVTKFPIIDAMLTVPREDFLPAVARQTAYSDGPIKIADGRSALEPRTFAKMLEAVDIQPDELVLAIGAGLGYSPAVLARLCEAVVALEEDEALSEGVESQLAKANVDNAAVITGPLVEGAAKHGPYDVIFVDGAVEDIPSKLTDQLKDGGRLVAIFMDGPLGVCRIGLKTGDSVSWRDAFNATAEILPGFRHQSSFEL